MHILSLEERKRNFSKREENEIRFESFVGDELTCSEYKATVRTGQVLKGRNAEKRGVRQRSHARQPCLVQRLPP